ALGWTNPVVIGSLVGGTALLGVFVWIETRVRHPMFRLQLFAIRLFALGNGAAFLFALARGGIQFLLIIWLQAVWLPLHGVAYARTPLLAGAYTLPLILGFSLAAPVGGWLSDRHGNRALAFAGSLLVLAGSAALTTLPADFPLLPFCLLQFPI